MEVIPLFVKAAYTVMAVVVLGVYYVRRGPANFLWFSDIALMALVPALWLENSFLVSLVACLVLLPELAWLESYFGRLLLGRHLTTVADYMFDEPSPLWLRALSLFHVPLVGVMLWLLWQLGYRVEALPWSVALAWLVLPVCYLFTDAERNINHVHRFDWAWDQRLSRGQHFAVLMVGLPLVVQLPTHLLLAALFA